MKKLIYLTISLLLALQIYAQSPNSFNYQAVIRDSNGEILSDQNVGIQFTLLQGSATGSVVYQETFNPTTGANGLINLQIGAGNTTSGDFSSIDWSNGPFFVETALDINGGSSYEVMGTSQLLSVPFALYAANSGNSEPGPQGAAGADGKTILNGSMAPTTEGSNGDFYLNTTTNELYGPKIGGNWGSPTSLIGPAGNDGQDGADGQDGTDGEDGEDGENGADGMDGTAGQDGDDGADGNTVLSGSVSPTTEGVDGDFYINTATNEIYGPKSSGAWGSATSLKGADGQDGADGNDGNNGADGDDGVDGQDGENGEDGKTVLNGTVAPTTEGVDGDFYINTAMNEIYGPKTSGVWGSATSLVGTDGTDGSDGVDGQTVIHGTADPTTEGADGDFYINTSTSEIFGPKASGAWGAGTSLVGAAGSNGSDGADGYTVLNGASDPTSEGVDGDFYINTSSNEIFGPKASGVWGAGASLVGASGSDGSDGADGKTILNGTTAPTTEGVDGDFYLNTSTNELYGPKTTGSWGSAVSLVGPQGPQGPAGSSGGAAATYRWISFNTYSNSIAQWAFNNDANMFGGIPPSIWTDANGVAENMSSDKEVLRNTFTRVGYAKKNALITNDEFGSFSSTNGRVTMVLFRIKNNTGSTINWSPHVVYSAYSPWGEKASAALNGVSVMEENSSGTTVISNLAIPPSRTSTFIVVSTSSPPAGTPGIRLNRLGFISDTLELPAGLEFVDDLDTATGGWEQ